MGFSRLLIKLFEAHNILCLSHLDLPINLFDACDFFAGTRTGMGVDKVGMLSWISHFQFPEYKMTHELPRGSSFWSFLFSIDKDLAENTRRQACSCGGRLHCANYPPEAARLSRQFTERLLLSPELLL